MKHFYKFVLASVIFASSVVAKPAVGNTDKQAGADVVLCLNTELLDFDLEDCHVGKSLGMISSEECKEEGGSYYYCFNRGRNCFPLSPTDPDLIGGGYIGGECFAASDY